MPEYEPRLADPFWDLRDAAYDHPERWEVSASDIFQSLAELIEKAEDSGGQIEWRRDVVEPMLRRRSSGDNSLQAEPVRLCRDSRHRPADGRQVHQNEAMTEAAGNERAKRIVALLEDNVRSELQVTNDGFDLGLSEETIERLMEGVTSGLLYAFALDWSPDWVKPGDVHHWVEAGRCFARCGVCLADSPASPDEDTAVAWAHNHEASH